MRSVPRRPARPGAAARAASRQGGTTSPTLFVVLILGLLLAWFGYATLAGKDRDATPVVADGAQTARSSSPAAARLGTRTESGPVREGDSPSASTGRELRGRVQDVDGRPLADVGIGLAGSDAALATSDADGRFACPCPQRTFLLTVIDPKWACLAPLPVSACGSGAEPVLVAAPAIRISGRVVDTAQRPLAGADVRLVLPYEAAALVASAGRPPWGTQSGKDGHFEFASAPALRGNRLATNRAGHASDARELATRSSDQVIVLAPLQRELRGHVIHDDGTLVPGARVLFGSSETTSDELGGFAFVPTGVLADSPLVACVRGFQPAVERRFGELFQRTLSPVESVELVLGPATLRLSGRVLDEGGTPERRVRLALVDPTPLEGRANLRLEDLCRPETASPASARTDGNGSFVLEGLFDRPYVLRATDKRSGRTIESEPLTPPRDDIVLLFGARRAAALAGRVVSESGRPLAAARIRVRFGEGRELETTSDATGAFGFEGIPHGALTLTVTAAGILPLERQLTAAERDSEVVLNTTRARAWRFEAQLGGPVPEAACVLDADGNVVAQRRAANPERALRSIPLPAGRSDLLLTAPRAATLVLYRAGFVLDRIPLELTPDTTVVVSWP